MGRRNLHIALVAMGFTWVIAQVLLVRELMVAFHGNELIVGLALAGWLLAGALGSASAGRWADRSASPLSVFLSIQTFLAVALPAAVFGGRTLRPFLGLLPGELVAPGTMVAISALVLVPVGAACGGLFAAACRLPDVPEGTPDAPVAAVYVVEAAGSVLGGVAFTFILIPYLNALRIALLASTVLLGVGLLLCSRRPRPTVNDPLRKVSTKTPWAVLLAVLLAADLVLLLSPLADSLDRWAAQSQWGRRNVVFNRDSAYGNVAVLLEAGQLTFVVSGIPDAVTPVPDIAAVEEAAHLPMLFHPDPRTVLLIGGGIGGVLTELLKYPVERIDYVELDPLLFQAAEELGDPFVRAEMADPRVHIHIADGRHFVEEVRTRYDVILIGLPPPATLGLNRFYTREWFRRVRRVLRGGGLVAVPCPASTTYLGDEARALNASLQATLQAEFPHVRAIPGETALFLASVSPDIKVLEVTDLERRLAEWAIPTRLISSAHLAYKFHPATTAWFERILTEGPTTQANTDLTPVSLHHTIAYQIAPTSPTAKSILTRLRRLTLAHIALPLVVLALVVALALRRTGDPLQAAVPLVLAATGLAGMALTVVLLLTYQTFCGVLYQQLGLFTATSALGLALGGALARRPCPGRTVAGAVIVVESGLIVAAACLPLLLPLLEHVPRFLGQAFLLGMTALVGGFVGAQFPPAARICVREAHRIAAPGGALYAADLVGACIGALSVSALLVPTLGLGWTCLLIAIVKLLSLSLLWANRRP